MAGDSTTNFQHSQVVIYCYLINQKSTQKRLYSTASSYRVAETMTVEYLLTLSRAHLSTQQYATVEVVSFDLINMQKFPWHIVSSFISCLNDSNKKICGEMKLWALPRPHFKLIKIILKFRNFYEPLWKKKYLRWITT